MRKLVITAPAQADLAAIDGYLRFELSNVQAAEHFLDEVLTAYDAVVECRGGWFVGSRSR